MQCEEYAMNQHLSVTWLDAVIHFNSTHLTCRS